MDIPQEPVGGTMALEILLVQPSDANFGLSASRTVTQTFLQSAATQYASSVTAFTANESSALECLPNSRQRS